jgi:hypothetical protein
MASGASGQLREQVRVKAHEHALVDDRVAQDNTGRLIRKRWM